MAQACAHLCHQRRHLLNDVGGNGESGGESSIAYQDRNVMERKVHKSTRIHLALYYVTRHIFLNYQLSHLPSIGVVN